jgi:hypothetical protein
VGYKTFKWVLVKSVIFLLVFSLLHYIHELIPIFPFAIIGGVSESVFQHIKIAYFSYIFTVLIEMGIFRKKIDNIRNFWDIRLITILLIPWLEFILWYVGPAFGELHSLAVELTFSFVVLYLMGIFAGMIEISSTLTLGRMGRTALVVLNAVAIFIFAVYSFKDPYIDVFLLHEH